MNAPGTCTVDGCMLKVSVKRWQFCAKHYQAFWRYGDPNGNPRNVRGQHCKAPGCDRRRSSHEGLCGTHSRRMKRHGLLEKPPPRPCNVSGCERTAQAKGLCQRHYDLARGSHRNTERPCCRSGCTRSVKARGLCRTHYSELQRLGMLATAPLQSELKATDKRLKCRNSECDQVSADGRWCSAHRPICRGCGAELTAPSRGVRYCADKCKPRCSGPSCDRKVSGRELCSTHLKQQNRGEELRVISREVRTTTNGPCEWCNTPVGPGSRSRYCSVVCRGLARRHTEVSVVGKCVQCGQRIDYLAPANGGGQRLTPISKRLCDHCRHRSASLYMSAEALRARDGDSCNICGLLVPDTLLDPHPLAGQVDHVISIARGGTHNPNNLALVHRTCNAVKRDKPAGWRRAASEVQPLLDDWLISGTIMHRTECSVPGCDRRSEAMGMCQKHRRRVQKHGSHELPARPTSCLIDDCPNAVRARGLCRSHYRQWLNSKAQCSEFGCDKNANTRGLCKPHYRRWLLNRPGQPPCAEPRCLRKSEVRGYCDMHYKRHFL